MLPAEPRLPSARELVEQSRYFVVHAPRQTGKTTSLAALARDVNAGGRHAALLFSCEEARYAGDDVAAAQQVILDSIAGGTRYGLAPRATAAILVAGRARRQAASCRAERGRSSARPRSCCSSTRSTPCAAIR